MHPLQEVFGFMRTHFEKLLRQIRPGKEEVSCRLPGNIAGFQALNLDQPREDQRLIDRLLNQGSQGTRSKYQDFVNYWEFADRLEILGELDMRLVPQTSIKTHVEPAPPNIQDAMLWDAEFDSFFGTYDLAGTAVVSADAPARGKLFLETKEFTHPINWDPHSPKIQRKLSPDPYVHLARFESLGVNLTADESAKIIRDDGRGDQFVIARLEAPSLSANDSQRSN